MIYVEQKNGDVSYVHYVPFDEKHGLGKTQQELEQTGFFVAEIPQPEVVKGKTAALKVDVTTKTFSYEYTDIPDTEVDEITKLKEKQELMQQAIDFLLMGGM